MIEQLQHLLEAPAVVQVVPAETDIPAGLSGAFVVATVGERHFAFLTAPGRGFVLDDHAVIPQEHRNWDVLGREALTPRQSRDLILRVADEWKNASCVAPVDPVCGSDNDSCVEIAVAPGRVLVRDSKDPRGPVLRVSAAEWREFLTDLRA